MSKKNVMPAKRALKSVFCHGSAGAKNTSIRTSVRFGGKPSNRARSADVPVGKVARLFRQTQAPCFFSVALFCFVMNVTQTAAAGAAVIEIRPRSGHINYALRITHYALKFFRPDNQLLTAASFSALVLALLLAVYSVTPRIVSPSICSAQGLSKRIVTSSARVMSM